MKQGRDESVKLQLQFYDKYEWPVEITESLLEVRQYLSESTILNLYQNYYFAVAGNRINEYADHSLEDGTKVQIILDEFNERTARYHLGRVQELINNLGYYQYLARGKLQQTRDEFPFGQQQLTYEAKDLQLNDVLVPQLKADLLLPQQPQKPKQVIHTLGLSPFNPPVQSRRFKGDLFYISLRTIEGVEYVISATNLGYYVNSSTGRVFDATPKGEYYYCLMELVADLSPILKKELLNVQSECSVQPLPAMLKYNYSWLAYPEATSVNDPQKCESWALDLHGFDVTSLRDWNEELQVFRTLPKTDLISKLNRDKALVKVYNDFADAAVKGACAVVDKIIQPLNPMDTEYQQVYVYNQIFFSFALETPEDFRQESGPDATPTVSTTNCDFRNLSILHKLDISNLSVLNTCLVDYKGRRVIAQSIIPGILNSQSYQVDSSDHSNCTQYGSIDDGKTIQKSDEFHLLMKKVCESFHIESEIAFLDSNNKEFSMAGSIEVKGIQGSDKRMYLLDLLRLSPRDMNYLGDQNQCCVLRYELLQNYWVVSAISKIKEDQQKTQEALQNIQNILTGANREGLHLNPAIETKVQLKDKNEEQHQLLVKISQFLTNQAIPQLINELQQPDIQRHADLSVSDLFHSHGVNMRYLGRVISQINMAEQPSLGLMLERLVLCKSLKHVFRLAMRTAPAHLMSNVIAHLLNCIFGTPQPQQQQQIQQQPTQISTSTDQDKKKKKKNKNKNKSDDKKSLIQPKTYNLESAEVIWEQVKTIAKSRYSHQLDPRILNRQGFHKLSCLRELCQSIGLKLVARDYNGVFLPSDISGMEPVIKCIEQVSDDAKANIEIGQKYMLEHQNYQSALEAYLTATQIIMNLHGTTHKDLANCFSKMSGVYFRKQEFEHAIQFQKQAIAIYSQLYGQDHALTISAITGLSLYYFATKRFKEAFNYMLHSLYLASIVGGEGQEVYNQFTNLSLLYSESGQHQSALNCLFEALERCENLYRGYGGSEQATYKLRVCSYYSAIALEHSEIGDAQKAVEFQERAVEIFKKTLRPDDQRIKEAETLLQSLVKGLNEKRKDTQMQQSNQEQKRQFGTNRQQQQIKADDSQQDVEREALLQKLKVVKQNLKGGRGRNQVQMLQATRPKE